MRRLKLPALLTLVFVMLTSTTVFAFTSSFIPDIPEIRTMADDTVLCPCEAPINTDGDDNDDGTGSITDGRRRNRPANPGDPNGPSIPVNSDDPAHLGDSSEPTAPGDSTDPAVPDDSTEPAVPDDSTEPAVPDDSTETTIRDDSTEPAVPGDSTTSSDDSCGGDVCDTCGECKDCADDSCADCCRPGTYCGDEQCDNTLCNPVTLGFTELVYTGEYINDDDINLEKNEILNDLVFTYEAFLSNAELGNTGKPYRAGTYKITVTFSTDHSSGTRSSYLVINQKPLSLYIEFDDKDYDGTTDANYNSYVLSGVFTDDDVEVSPDVPVKFSTKNAGIDIPVLLDSIELTGEQSKNYIIGEANKPTADIYPVDLPIGATMNDKVFDGTYTISMNEISFTPFFDDEITIIGYDSISMEQITVGNGIPVTINGLVFGGADRDNYTITENIDSVINIIPATLYFTAGVSKSKPYDQLTNIDIYSLEFDNLIPGFTDVHFNGTGTAFVTNPDAGKNKAVTLEGQKITGKDAYNYILSLSSTPILTEITTIPVMISCIVEDKIYDGSTEAEVKSTSIKSGILPGDDVTLPPSISVEFVSKNAGEQNTFIREATLDGKHANNYHIKYDTEVTAKIHKLALDAIFPPFEKIYDGLDTISVHGIELIGIVTIDGIKDDVTIENMAVAGRLDSVDTGITTASFDFILGGEDANNYTTLDSIKAPVTIHKREIYLTIQDKFVREYKEYDSYIGFENFSFHSKYDDKTGIVPADVGVVTLYTPISNNVNGYKWAGKLLSLNSLQDTAMVGSNTVSFSHLTLTDNAGGIKANNYILFLPENGFAEILIQNLKGLISITNHDNRLRIGSALEAVTDFQVWNHADFLKIWYAVDPGDPYKKRIVKSGYRAADMHYIVDGTAPDEQITFAMYPSHGQQMFTSDDTGIVPYTIIIEIDQSIQDYAGELGNIMGSDNVWMNNVSDKGAENRQTYSPSYGNSIDINYNLWADDDITSSLYFDNENIINILNEPHQLEKAANYRVDPGDAIDGIITLKATFVHKGIKIFTQNTSGSTTDTHWDLECGYSTPVNTLNIINVGNAQTDELSFTFIAGHITLFNTNGETGIPTIPPDKSYMINVSPEATGSGPGGTSPLDWNEKNMQSTLSISGRSIKSHSIDYSMNVNHPFEEWVDWTWGTGTQEHDHINSRKCTAPDHVCPFVDRIAHGHRSSISAWHLDNSHENHIRRCIDRSNIRGAQDCHIVSLSHGETSNYSPWAKLNHDSDHQIICAHDDTGINAQNCRIVVRGHSNVSHQGEFYGPRTRCGRDCTFNHELGNCRLEVTFHSTSISVWTDMGISGCETTCTNPTCRRIIDERILHNESKQGFYYSNGNTSTHIRQHYCNRCDRNTGSSTDIHGNWTTWSPATSTRCTRQSFTQNRNCGVCSQGFSQGATGSGSHVLGAWGPATNTVCVGANFTQTRSACSFGCGQDPTSQSVAGSRSHNQTAWTPLTDTVCVGGSFTQNNSCSHGCGRNNQSQSVTGTRAHTFNHPADTGQCYGQFTNTVNCSHGCGTSDSKILWHTSHNPTPSGNSSPTCTSGGYSGRASCSRDSRCGIVTQGTWSNALGHSPVTSPNTGMNTHSTRCLRGPGCGYTVTTAGCSYGGGNNCSVCGAARTFIEIPCYNCGAEKFSECDCICFSCDGITGCFFCLNKP